MEPPAIAVVHPQLVAGGGSEACALGILEALQDESRLTLMTLGRPDFAALNRAYGTAVDPARFECHALPVPALMRKRFAALRGFRLARYCRRRAPEFDVMISAYNVMDFGRRGIQVIGDFSFDDNLRRSLFPESGARPKAFYRASRPRDFYLRLGRRLSGTTEAGWKRNLTVSNSAWIRNLMRTRFDVDSTVLYPPVQANAAEIPWGERENGFVLMARLVPEKGVENIVGILDVVRRHLDVHLHILGRRDDPECSRRIEGLARDRSEWMSLEGRVSGEAKTDMLARHRYGISGCRHEAFGIAVAEMVRAGMIVWVPGGGGQVEIVGESGLIYGTPAEAVSRILAVIGDTAKEDEMRRRLGTRAAMFTAERFRDGIRNVVRGFLAETRRADA